MATIKVKCPHWNETSVVMNRKHGNETQRYLCQNPECPQKTFILDYTNKGCEPGIDEKIIKMAANGSGIRDIARVLGISIQKYWIL